MLSNRWHFRLIDDYQDFLIRVIKNSGHEFDYVRVFESTFIGPAELSKSINNQEYIRIGSQLACESDAVRKKPESPRRLVLRRDAMWIDAWRVQSENDNEVEVSGLERSVKTKVVGGEP